MQTESRPLAAWLFLLPVLAVTACWNEAPMTTEDEEIAPPMARVEPKALTMHGDTRVDEYYWIRDDTRSDPEVIALLEAENAYAEKAMAHTAALQDALFDEIAGRLVEEDATVPVRQGDYYYHREFRAGGEYPVYLRRRADKSATAEVILDVNELSRGHDYYQVANWSVSFDDDVLAWAEDTVSRREYALRFKRLDTGESLPDRIENTSGDIAWANDQTVFYVAREPETLLPYRVYRHRLGTERSSDVLVYEEHDPAFYTSVYTSRSEAFVVIAIQSTDSSEIRLIDANRPDTAPVVFLPREANHEYRIRHVSGTFYVITNWGARNFRLMGVAEDAIGDKRRWHEVIPHRPGVLLEDVEVFTDYLVVRERSGGLSHLRVIDRRSGEERDLDFADPAYTVRLHSNPEVNTDKLRYVYSSLTTPETVYEYDMSRDTTVRLKQEEIKGDFDPSSYTSERIYITARDGTDVPVSLVYRTDRREPGENPLYIYAYGSYGFPVNPSFSSLRLSLLDRGFVYAIVHVRGGNELGRAWYEDGKLLHKKNTFTDFIDATRELVRLGYGHADRVFAAGRSAGGLLMGVVANEAPELYLGIVAHVPFVDILTTMLDVSIPLTTGEFTEWGDPREKRYYDYMKSYSPYDQVKAQDYPNMLVTTGLWDSQVQYFEPVKWVSRLRRLKTDDNLLILHVDMETGHGGASGRYERYREDALEYAFVLDLLPPDWGRPGTR